MLANIFGSIGLGALTGLVGPIVSAWTAHVSAKLDLEKVKSKQAHDLAMVDAESKAMIAETQAQIQVTKEKTKGAVELEEARAYAASQKPLPPAFKESYMSLLPTWTQAVIATLFAFSDIVSKTVRPVLTYYIMGCATWVTWLSWSLVNKAGVDIITVTQALDLFDKVIYFILYMATSSFTWWFTDRATAKNMAQHLEKK